MFQYITISIERNNIIVDKATNMVFNPSDMNLFDLSQIQSLGLSLYTHSFIYIIIASFVFILAMIGPIIITSRRRY